MVREGDFALELVDASTKRNFQEHTGPDGRVYVEIEPGAEYFLKIAAYHNRSAEKGGEGEGGLIRAEAYIDEVDLGYTIDLSDSSQAELMGLWNVRNGESTTTALKVANTPPTEYSQKPSLWTGKVKVNFFESIDTGRSMKLKNVKSRWHKGDVAFLGAVSQGCARKGVMTEAGGSSVISNGFVDCTDRYEMGKLLGSIEVQYCTALGLIFANILPKPPYWELARKRFPRTQAEHEITVFTPERVKVPAETASDGTVLKPAREYDYFDLTNMSDYSDEEDG